MNLPQGYKQTELGVIPEDWEIKTLGELGSFSKGSGISRAEANTGSIPCVRYGEIYTHHNDYIKKYNSFISSEVAQKAKLLHYGDILFAGSGETKEDIGKSIAFIENIQAYAGGDIIILSTDTNICDAKFIGYISNTSFVNKQKATKGQGDAVVHITSDSLKNISILLPPLPEQKAIAEALSDVDDLITALDKKIAKKRLIKQGAMQELLTGKKRLPGFTNKWVEKPIRLLCKLYGRIGFRGYTKADLVHKGEGAITFSPSDIHEQVISYTNCDYISWRKYDESPEIQVFNGDIIFCKTASIGKCAIIKNLSEKATINPQFVVLKDFKCNNEWLYYSIIDRKFQTVVSGITGGSTIPTMSQEKLYEQTLLCPPTIEEQQAIATILSDMDKEIADLEVQRDKYRLLKSGMMQKLLTGEIRLKK